MDTFSALAEPTRREILLLLANSGELSASSIYHNFTVSPPAISQHLKVLRDAELVTVKKHAQQRMYTVNPVKIIEIEDWIRKLTQQYEDKFERFDMLLEKEKQNKAIQKDS